MKIIIIQKQIHDKKVYQEKIQTQLEETQHAKIDRNNTYTLFNQININIIILRKV